MKNRLLSALLVAVLVGLPALFAPVSSSADDTTTIKTGLRLPARF